MVDRRDLSQPIGGVEGQDGAVDLGTVEGGDLVGQRVERIYFTQAGEVHHRPEWGADLVSMQGEPDTPGRRERLRSRAKRALGGLSFVDGVSLSIDVDADRALRLRTVVRYRGEELEIPDVVIQ